MASKDGKTEAPTPKRKKDARKKGQVAFSQDLGPWITSLVGTYLVPALVTAIRTVVVDSARSIQNVDDFGDPAAALHTLTNGLGKALMAVAPLLAMVAGVGAVVHFAQTGASFSFHPLKPDFKRVNPIQGAKKLFSPKRLWMTGQQVAKSAVIVFVGLPRARALVDTLGAHQGRAAVAGVSEAAMAILSLVRTICWTVVALAIVDYFFQRRRLRNELKMTKQEIKEELKHSEGDPHVKGRIRAIQAGMSRRRMMGDVPSANVVITNPTHIAVALRYDPSISPAPQVVAVGLNGQAAKIRAIATDSGVPIVEAKPLARALWRTCNVGDTVPATLYEAVARVLVFVRRLRNGLSRGVTVELPQAFTTDAEYLAGIRRKGRRR